MTSAPRPETAAVYVVQVLKSARGPFDLEWEDAFQFNDDGDAFDKYDELAANGDAPRVVRRWVMV